MSDVQVDLPSARIFRRPCYYDAPQLAADLLAGCGKTISVQQNFDGPHVWHKSGLSGYLVCLVHLVDLVCFVYLVHLVCLVGLVYLVCFVA